MSIFFHVFSVQIAIQSTWILQDGILQRQDVNVAKGKG